MLPSPKIIEVNARPAGDKIPLLVRAVTGYDLREVALHLALGETLANAPHHPIEAHSATARFLIGEREGRIKMPNSESIAGLPGVQSVKLEVRNGTPVTPTTNNYNRLGYFIAHGTNVQGADLVAENVLKHIDLRIYDPSAESC